MAAFMANDLRSGCQDCTEELVMHRRRTQIPVICSPWKYPYAAHAAHRRSGSSNLGMYRNAAVINPPATRKSRNRYQKDSRYEGLKQCAGIALRKS